MSAVVQYVTPSCMICHKTSTLTLSAVALAQWEQGAYIQDAFGDLSPADRELIKTGTHPACWTRMFGDDMDEEDDE